MKTIQLRKLGDFYEVLGEQAAPAADLLDLRLVQRKINGELVAMCGFPYHQLAKMEHRLESLGIVVEIVTQPN